MAKTKDQQEENKQDAGQTGGDDGEQQTTAAPAKEKTAKRSTKREVKRGDFVDYETQIHDGANLKKETRTAIVIQVQGDGRLRLAIFDPNNLTFKHGVTYSEKPEVGTWRFPEE